jgi:hypothetical protein
VPGEGYKKTLRDKKFNVSPLALYIDHLLLELIDSGSHEHGDGEKIDGKVMIFPNL